MGNSRTLSTVWNQFIGRALDGGGFPNRPGQGFRPDATAWAVLAIAGSGRERSIVEHARNRLVDAQRPDGRVSVTHEHPEAHWPTPVAALAWHGSPGHRHAESLATQFLLSTSGRQFVSEPNGPLSHDTTLRGWSWVSESHSMVEPTALAILALRRAGYGDHDRTREAIWLLRNRQLPSGGWNYGNTLVYGQELYPQPETTGLALAALAGAVPKHEVLRSLDYVRGLVPVARTPLSLGWALLGLRAWGIRPQRYRTWIGECFRRQETYGEFDTASLALLLIAFSSGTEIFRPSDTVGP